MVRLLGVYNETSPHNARCEISITSVDDLNNLTTVGGYTMTEGSLAWEIETGDFYALKANGTWYKQDGSGAVG